MMRTMSDFLHRDVPRLGKRVHPLGLGNPHVDVVLTAPASRAELEANLAELSRGPLDPGRLDEVRALGRAVHG
jgi:hypothetical protein